MRRPVPVAAAVGLLVLTGCGQLGGSDHPERSAEHGRQIEADLPALVDAAGWDGVGVLAEKSCLGDPEPSTAARETKWIGSATRDVGPGDAERLAGQISRRTEDLGWTPQGGAGPRGDWIYGATKGDLTLVVTHRTSGGAHALSLGIHSPCLEMPAGHTMTRSGLDPMYGSSDPLYPNDDRSTFTHGEPQPLPAPSSNSTSTAD